MKHRVILFIIVGVFLISNVFAKDCVDCHKKISPNIVSDWELSKHSKQGVDCSICHGDKHQSEKDISKTKIPTPDTCAQCHSIQVEQYKSGKHSIAWAAMQAMPTIHWQPMVLTKGKKGCGGCHKIGLKTEDEIKDLKKEGSIFGTASCDSCHTRHIFSVEEAKQPQACQTCHMGFDHPQWEMYSTSKHGVRYLLKQNKILPETASAPTCQTCHMSEGNHSVGTGWGFLAVRLPMPDDKQWAADRVLILQALGVLDPNGNPTGRFDVVKAAKIAKLTQHLSTPYISPDRTHIFHQYTVRVNKQLRDKLAKYLKEQGIPTMIYYPLPLHLQPAFKFLDYKKGDFPEAEKAAKEVLSLPIYPEIPQKEQDYIIKKIQEFFKSA